MSTFATELPIANDRSISDLLKVCTAWILGSPHTALDADDLKDATTSEDWNHSKGDETVALSRCSSDESDIGGLRYFRKEETGLEWTSEVVGVKSSETFWVSIRVSCVSCAPAAKLPAPRKPYIVGQLIRNLGCDMDGKLQLSEKPHILDNISINKASAYILGKAKNRLPIIYVSSTYTNTPVISPDELARSLAGMAHVVVEPNRAFSSRLMIEVNRMNVYGGAVGIYWPDGAGRKTYFLGTQYRKPEDIEKAIIDDVREALANRRPSRNCTWAYLREILSRKTYEKLKREGSTELGKYVDAFDEEVSAKNSLIKDAEAEITRLQTEVMMLEARCASMTDRAVIACGKEQDFYLGEINDIVLDALIVARRNVQKNSRRQHLLDDIFEKNKKQGEAKKLEEQLKATLRSYRSMTSRVRAELERLGFLISDDGKHYKAIFHGDGRYTFSISKTSSDHRAGMNLASEITSTLF